MLQNAHYFFSSGLSQAYFESNHSHAKPTVVFVHGFPHTHELWRDQVSEFGETHRVITYDLRGFGESEGAGKNYLIDYYVDDLIALLDHLKLPKATVCGLSMGGYIALRAIAREPSRFNGLILADTSAEPDQNAAKLKRLDLVKTLDDQGLSTFVDAVIKGVLQPATIEQSPERLTDLDHMIRENSEQAITGALAALSARLDLNDTLSQISVPTLILVGEEDKTTPPELSEKLKTQIDGSELVKIPRAGHLSNWENPEAFNHALRAFLKKMPELTPA